MFHASRTVTEAQLESAPIQAVHATRAIPVVDADALKDVYVALGPRLGVIQIQNSKEYKQLRAAAPDVGPQPDFTGGTLIGVVSWLGTAVDERPGVELAGLQMAHGAGLLRVRYRSGCYLPDGSAMLTLAYVPDLQRLLVVTAGGTTFYLDENR